MAGGLQARLMYAQYQQSRDTSLRERLTDYSRDDLDGLVGVVRRFKTGPDRSRKRWKLSR